MGMQTVVHPTISHSLSLSSRPLRTALLRACSGRTAFSSSLQPTFSRLSFFSPRAFRSPLVSFRIASLSSRPLRTSLLAALGLSPLASRRLFARAFLTRSFPTPRSLFKEALLACSIRSFIRALLHSALARSARFCSSSCLVSASSLLVPRLSSLAGSTPLIRKSI